MVRRVLVIDDESVTRRVVSYALQAINVEVIAVEDGNSALEYAQDHEIGLAIVDINLPDLDGFELIRRLRAIPHLQHIPTILFTARNVNSDQEAALQVGANGFLYKPFSTQELRDLVIRYLGKDE